MLVLVDHYCKFLAADVGSFAKGELMGYLPSHLVEKIFQSYEIPATWPLPETQTILLMLSWETKLSR
jgi:hypothetical protein